MTWRRGFTSWQSDEGEVDVRSPPRGKTTVMTSCRW